jgi:hypothetical protein
VDHDVGSSLDADHHVVIVLAICLYLVAHGVQKMSKVVAVVLRR